LPYTTLFRSFERRRHQSFRLQAFVVHAHGGRGVDHIDRVDRRERREGPEHPQHGDHDEAVAASLGRAREASQNVLGAPPHNCCSLLPPVSSSAPGLVQSRLLFARTQAADAVTWTRAAVETVSSRPVAALRTLTRTAVGSSAASIHVDFHTRSAPAYAKVRR